MKTPIDRNFKSLEHFGDDGHEEILRSTATNERGTDKGKRAEFLVDKSETEDSEKKSQQGSEAKAARTLDIQGKKEENGGNMNLRRLTSCHSELKKLCKTYSCNRSTKSIPPRSCQTIAAAMKKKKNSTEKNLYRFTYHLI